MASALRIQERDLSTAAGRAATLLATLPIFLLLSAFIGGMGAAADMMAGERERASLEFLLLHPVPRGALVAGKWAAASALSLATVVLTLWGSQAVLRHPRVQAFDVPIGLSTADAAQMGLVLAPLALLATALQVLIALFARTYKEAHTQLSLMIFVPMLPGFLFAFGSLDTQAWMAWTPMIGQHLAIAGLLRGEPAPASVLAVLTAITVSVTGLAWPRRSGCSIAKRSSAGARDDGRRCRRWHGPDARRAVPAHHRRTRTGHPPAGGQLRAGARAAPGSRAGHLARALAGAARLPR